MTKSEIKNGEKPLRLNRLQIENFRRIKELDISIPDSARVICFIGPNGAGKSALLSVLIHSLFKLTIETAPEIPRDKYKVIQDSPLIRTISTAEIGPEGRALVFYAEWSSQFGEHVYKHFVRHHEKLDDAVIAELSGKYGITADEKQWWQDGWGQKKVNIATDPVARSVFLVRSSSRYETPVYEEKEVSYFAPALSSSWEGHRLLPILSSSRINDIEALFVNFLLDAQAGHADSQTILQKIIDTLNYLNSDYSQPNVQPWPFRRVGVKFTNSLSSLSSGEMDFLVTVAEIAAQQLYLKRKFNLNIEAHGIVFIDEVDAHLHPEWQEKVVSHLIDTFPNITYFITTHSPFVVRGLPKDKSIVVRLPEGDVFDGDFSSWSTDDILNIMFEVSAEWAPETAKMLNAFGDYVRNPDKYDAAIEIFVQLALRSSSIRASLDRILAVYGDIEIRDRISALDEEYDMTPEEGDSNASS